MEQDALSREIEPAAVEYLTLDHLHAIRVPGRPEKRAPVPSSGRLVL
ncbi:hypothetical protein ACFVH0_34560 [Streptomyces sp. NPDC127117]